MGFRHNLNFSYTNLLFAVFFALLTPYWLSATEKTGNRDHQLSPPSFSQQSGFFTEGFALELATGHTGTYAYSISREGYQTVSGELTVTGHDKEVHIVLPSLARVKNGDPGTRPDPAGTHQVVFEVDMTDSPYAPGDIVYISGTMTNPQWPEPGSDPGMVMEPAGGEESLFRIFFALPTGDYAYKYFLHDGWGDGEWSGQPNREVSVHSDTIFRDTWGVIGPDDPFEGAYTVTFSVSDDQGNPINDAVVVFDGIAHEPGHYRFEGIFPAAEIRYTTDGSIPHIGSSLYTSPINVSSRAGDPNTISMIPTNNIGPGHHYNEHWQEPAGEVFKINTIRARAFLPDGKGSRTETHSYLVDEKGAERYSLPIISINAHAGAFFEPDSGIYVYGNHGNYSQRGREWERLVHFAFFEKDGWKSFSQDMGARIHGGTSRNRPRKSLRMYARSDYGTTWVDYPLFPEKDIDRYKRFILRNSGNDWSESVFRDAFMQSLMKDIGLDIQYSRPAIVFINGEYWGIHNIRDRLDNRYLQTHYGLDDPMDYTILERNAEFDRGNPDGKQHYLDMIDFLENQGVADDDNFAELETMMDINNFTNYQIGQIYVMNTDWPGNNIQYWRYYTDTYDPDAPEGLDGRWRWQVFDLDFGFGLDFDYVQGVNEGPAHNTLAFALEPNGPHWPNPPWATRILRSLLGNDAYRDHFVTRFNDLLNTRYSASFVTGKLARYRDIYLPEMPEHIDRWRMPDGMDHWDSEIGVMHDFAMRRPGYMRQYLREEFGLGEEKTLTVGIDNPAGGSVRVNTIQIGESHWEGIYFQDMPMSLEAVPDPGYRFSHWEGTYAADSAKISFLMSDDTEMLARFENALLHYWHFNNLPGGDLSTAEADFSASGGAEITYGGEGEGYMDRTDGTLLNAHQGASAGYGLRVRNPSHERKLIVEAPSSGYEDLVFSFAVHRTTNGAREQAFHYSVDGGENWIQLGDPYTIDPEYDTVVIDMTGIEETNDNPDLQFKIRFLGEEAAGEDGNNRFDNVVVTGTALELSLDPAPPLPGHKGEQYTGHYFTASGGVPPYSYSIFDGRLPDGLFLSDGGHLSGTPDESGTFPFAVMVEDNQGTTHTREFALEIDDIALIHYWHFNNLPDGSLDRVEADLSAPQLPGIIRYPGTGDGYMDRSDGTLLNVRKHEAAGYGLRVRNPSDTRELIITASSEGFRDLTLSFAVHRTTNGAQQQQLYYSPDGGTTWSPAGHTYGIGPDYVIQVFDLSQYEEVNNNPLLRLKIVFLGEEAAGDSGNNRFDNVVLAGERHTDAVDVGEPGQDTWDTLGQNYPNPFSHRTTIPFDIERGGVVRLDVFSIYGRHVANLVDGYVEPGHHEVVFDGNPHPGGMYIYRLQCSEGIRSRQMILIR